MAVCREYRCNNCNNEFEQYETLKQKPRKKCPECKKMKLERLLSLGMGFVRQDPRTLGHFASRKTDNMGTYEKQEVRRKHRESSAMVDSVLSRKEHEHDMKMTKGMATSRELDKMSRAEKTRYIVEGKK